MFASVCILRIPRPTCCTQVTWKDLTDDTVFALKQCDCCLCILSSLHLSVTPVLGLTCLHPCLHQFRQLKQSSFVLPSY